MQLADELLKSFAKITNDKERKTDDSAKGTVVVQENTTYVQLDGSEVLTPVEITAGNKNGDRVLVSIKNHKATILGNYTDPSATTGSVSAVAALTAAAQALAEVAETAANNAQTAANTAQGSADAAGQQANRANRYADAALNQLGVVQDVIGVLDWASSHGSFSLTSDLTIQNGKVYFIYNTLTGDYEPVVSPDAAQLSTYYELTVDDAMQSYIMTHLVVTSRGLWVLPSGINTGYVTPDTGETLEDARARLGNNYKLLLSNSGTIIYNGSGLKVASYSATDVSFYDSSGVCVATFGANQTVIGDPDQTHLMLDYHSIQGVSKEGTYFFASDLRNGEGLATIPERFEPNLPDNTYDLYYTAVSLVSVTVNGTELDASKYSMSGNTVTITNVNLTADDVIIISYTTRSSKATAYTFGSRKPGATVGGMSVAYGNDVEASGVASFAGGLGTLAADRYAFAIGRECEATGWASYAGGLYSKASKQRSVAYGYKCESTGYDSVAFGHNTKNSTDHSLAIGHWNKPGNYAFSVGNGTSENNRSNAVEVDWNGNWGVHGNEIPDQTNTRYLGNGTYRWQNVYSHYLDASANITAGAVKSFTPTWASGQNPAHYHCVVSAGLCSFSYQGQGVAHSANASIGTLPTGARPTSELYVPFVKMGGGVVGVIVISTAGAIKVDQISSASSTGRIYFNCSFPVV